MMTYRMTVPADLFFTVVANNRKEAVSEAKKVLRLIDEGLSVDVGEDMDGRVYVAEARILIADCCQKA